jgi:predicted nucleotidyltransferase
LVSTILNANLPPCATVWVFGSRATGGARRYSDLDLAIDAGRPLTLDEIACLDEAFSNSDLPYKVDLVDWQSIDPRFRNAIASYLRPFMETG